VSKNSIITAVACFMIVIAIASCMSEPIPPPQKVSATLAPTATAIPPTFTPSYTPTPYPTDTPTGPRDQFGDGLWRVGIDIIPGQYRTEGGEGCYWERMKDFKAVFVESTIANGNPTGPFVIEIEPSDAGFMSQRCGVWLKVN
jgi:hypothetical protein